MTKLFPILGLLLCSFSYYNDQKLQSDPCSEAKAAAEVTTALSKTKEYNAALTEIQKAFLQDRKEHVITFGKDSNNNVTVSKLSTGDKSNGKVPYMSKAFADLHNHPGNHPPDAGDLYGLIDLYLKQKDYTTRFVTTQSKAIYALVITNPAAADTFNINYPRDLSGCSACSPKFPEAIVDEFREMKYGHGCTDEMALVYLLEKYNAGISLLKQDSNGSFHKLRTSGSQSGNALFFTTNNCQ